MSGGATTGDQRRDALKTFEAPQVFNDELLAFYHAHFSDVAVARFGETFLQPGDAVEPQKDDTWDEWDEDDLGYYEDGVKRTLTDEQIEIFRHSELRDLQRQREKEAAKSKNKTDANAAMDEMCDSEDAPSLHGSTLPSSFRSNKKRKKKGTSRPKPEPKPDLRKRTWDVVDKGLDSLDYD